LFASESYELSKSDNIARIHFAWNSIFCKIFKVNDVNIIHYNIDFTVRVEMDVRNYKFLGKLF